VPAYLQGKRLWQFEQVRKPWPKETPDETKDYGDEAPAVSSPRDGSADSAADTCDNQEEYEPWYCESHDRFLSLRSIRQG